MTGIPKGKELRRRVTGRDGKQLTVRLTDSGFYVKEYGRRGGEQFVSWWAAYEWAAWQNGRKKKVTRGLISTEDQM
jgi:hypothetical protein